MTLDTAKLREVAEAATQGPWREEEHFRGDGIAVKASVDIDCGTHVARTVCEVGPVWSDDNKANARFIATFDPPTVLRLLDLAASPPPPEVAGVVERLYRSAFNYDAAPGTGGALLREAAAFIERLAREREEALAEIERRETRELTPIEQRVVAAEEDAKISREFMEHSDRRCDVAQAEVERLRGALEPFAAVAKHDIGESESDDDLFRPMSREHARAPLLKVGDFRNAAAAAAAATEEAT